MQPKNYWQKDNHKFVIRFGGVCYIRPEFFCVFKTSSTKASSDETDYRLITYRFRDNLDATAMPKLVFPVPGGPLSK